MKLNRLFAGIALVFSLIYVASVTTPLAYAADDAKETVKKATSVKKAAKKEATKEARKEAAFVGSKEGKTYHEAGCGMAKKIKPENLVKFASKAEAEKAGYAPCKICLKG